MVFLLIIFYLRNIFTKLIDWTSASHFMGYSVTAGTKQKLINGTHKSSLMNPSYLVNESEIVVNRGKKKDSWKTDFQLKDWLSTQTCKSIIETTVPHIRRKHGIRESEFSLSKGLYCEMLQIRRKHQTLQWKASQEASSTRFAEEYKLNGWAGLGLNLLLENQI